MPLCQCKNEGTHQLPVEFVERSLVVTDASDERMHQVREHRIDRVRGRLQFVMVSQDGVQVPSIDHRTGPMIVLLMS